MSLPLLVCRRRCFHSIWYINKTKNPREWQKCENSKYEAYIQNVIRAIYTDLGGTAKVMNYYSTSNDDDQHVDDVLY
jgi:hypothetical protein